MNDWFNRLPNLGGTGPFMLVERDVLGNAIGVRNSMTFDPSPRDLLSSLRAESIRPFTPAPLPKFSIDPPLVPKLSVSPLSEWMRTLRAESNCWLCKGTGTWAGGSACICTTQSTD